jgi:hypothetical protein
MGADCNLKNGRTVKLRRQGGASRIAEAFQPISLFLPPIGLGVFTGCSIGKVNPVVALNSALRFTPLEIMPRSVFSPAIAGLKFLTG